MTISTTNNKMEYTSDGILVAYTLDYKVLDATHMTVYLDGVLQSSGYTVDLNADQDNDPGGTVTLDTAPAAGVLITLLRTVPLTQLVDYQPYDPFPAATHERALDNLTLQNQQQQEEIDRNSQGIGTEPGVDTTAPVYDAGKGWMWSESDPKKIVNSDVNLNQLGLQVAADASAASTSAYEASVSEGWSYKWAQENEDVPVDDGVHPSGFSAYHWAKKSEATAAAGEANLGSNLGAGEGVFAQKSVVTLEFKSLVAAGTLGIASDADEITLTGTGLADAPSDGKEYVRKDAAWEIATQSGGVPIGSVIMWAGIVGDIPVGWQVADGTNGTVNLLGKFARGIDVGATGIDPDGERAVGNSQLDELKSHTHDNGAATGTSAGGGFGSLAGDTSSITSGGTGGAETRPVNVAVYYIQKVS